jgi:hypothetical protein
MYDPMDHLEETWTKNHSGRSRIRPLISKWIYRRMMIGFAKMFIVKFLNSTNSVEEIVDEWIASNEPPAFVRK